MIKSISDIGKIIYHILIFNYEVQIYQKQNKYIP